MKKGFWLPSLFSVLMLIGCAGIEPPSPEKLLTHPLGMGPIRVGMTKEEVKGLWGEPDLKKSLGESKDAGPTEREEWVYYGRVTNFPVNYGYLSKPLHMYFDGDNLTSFKEE